MVLFDPSTAFCLIAAALLVRWLVLPYLRADHPWTGPQVDHRRRGITRHDDDDGVS